MTNPKELVRDPSGVEIAKYSDDQGSCRLDTIEQVTIEGGRTKERRTVRKTRDTLDRMLEAQSISAEQYAAGRRFQYLCYLASINPSPRLYNERVSRSGDPTAPSDDVLDARQRVKSAVLALGGHSNPIAITCWYVLGCHLPIVDVCTRLGRRRTTVRNYLAEGLEMLAKRWGYG